MIAQEMPSTVSQVVQYGIVVLAIIVGGVVIRVCVEYAEQARRYWKKGLHAKSILSLSRVAVHLGLMRLAYIPIRAVWDAPHGIGWSWELVFFLLSASLVIVGGIILAYFLPEEE